MQDSTRPNCGTATGYTQHRQKYNESACEECRVAWRDYARALRGRHLDRSCVSCGDDRPAGSHKYCGKCADEAREYQRVNQRQFLCAGPSCHNLCSSSRSQAKFCSNPCKLRAKHVRLYGHHAVIAPHWVLSQSMLGPTLNSWPMFAPIKAPRVRECGCGKTIAANRKRCVECARRHNISKVMGLYDVAAKLIATSPHAERSAHMKRAMRLRYELVDYLRERDGDKCALCAKRMRFDVTTGPRGESDQGATVDHVLPRSHDGSNDLANLQLAHWACNRAKSNRGKAEQLRLVG